MKYSLADVAFAVAVGIVATGIFGFAVVLGASREVRERWHSFASA